MAQVTQGFIDETQGDGSGNDIRLIVNALIEALATKNSGPTPPPDPYPNMEWRDTANNILFQRDDENTVWEILKAFDKTGAPSSAENELDGYIQGSEWLTTDGRVWKHLGGGSWVEIGEAQQAALTAPTLGVLGGKRFAPEADGTVSAVVMGGPRFILGASAPTPVLNSNLSGFLASVRGVIPEIIIDDGENDPLPITNNLFPCLRFSSTTTGYLWFDFPILTAPTFLNFKFSQFLERGSEGTVPWKVSTALLSDLASITFGSETTLSETSAAIGIRETKHFLLHSAGAQMGDVLRVRLRRDAGTAGPIALLNLWIEQNP